MVYGLNNTLLGNPELEVHEEIHRHKDFASLEPHLTHDGIRAVSRTMTITVGAHLPEPLYQLQQEIARIEREWGLV